MRSNQFSGLETIRYPVLDLRGRAIAAVTIPYVKRLDEPTRMSATDTRKVLAATVTELNAALGSTAVRGADNPAPRVAGTDGAQRHLSR